MKQGIPKRKDLTGELFAEKNWNPTRSRGGNSMKVHQIQVGNMQNFSYIVEDDDTDEAIIIDPSWDLIELEMIIKKNNLKIKFIVNTHHHFDHTLGNTAMAESTKAPIIQHEYSELKHDIAVKRWGFY